MSQYTYRYCVVVEWYSVAAVFKDGISKPFQCPPPIHRRRIKHLSKFITSFVWDTMDWKFRNITVLSHPYKIIQITILISVYSTKLSLFMITVPTNGDHVLQVTRPIFSVTRICMQSVVTLQRAVHINIYIPLWRCRTS